MEYQRALRRISVVNALCRDARDRPLLLEALEKLFHCAEHMEMVGFKSGDKESGPMVLKQRQVDFSRVERFETWQNSYILYTVLYYIIYYITLYYITLYYILLLYYITLFCIILYFFFCNVVS